MEREGPLSKIINRQLLRVVHCLCVVVLCILDVSETTHRAAEQIRITRRRRNAYVHASAISLEP